MKAAITFHVRNTQFNLEDPAFKSITEAVEDTPQRIWTSVELHDLYTEKAEVCQQQESISRRQLVLMLAIYYATDLVAMRIDGWEDEINLTDSRLTVSKGKVTKASASLTQSIQSHITRNPNQTTLGLATKIRKKFGSREAIDLLHDFGYTASYEEVIRFRNSTAKFVG